MIPPRPNNTSCDDIIIYIYERRKVDDAKYHHTSTSLTFLFGIMTFVADELLTETLRPEAAPAEGAMTS